jgi:cytidylate kinase
MKLNEKFVISINRELGSGGRTVGELLARRLGVIFYDKALIKALTKKYNLSVEEIERLKGTNHSWWKDFVSHLTPFYDAAKSEFYRMENVRDKTQQVTSEEVFKVETKILKEIASAESCVIAGRSGFFVFRSHPNHISVLIQTPIKSRIERVMAKQNKTAPEARELIELVDVMRENYINRYTGTSRYDTRNYDLVINMDGLTENDAVDIIMQYIEKHQ